MKWTSKAVGACYVQCNCSDDDRVDRENEMAPSHRLAAGGVRLLYKLRGQSHSDFQKRMPLQMTGRVNSQGPITAG